MDLTNFTIPPDLFYSKSTSDAWKLKKLEKITPTKITSSVKNSVKRAAEKVTKRVKHSYKSKFKRNAPELGRVGKINRTLIKKKLLKKKLNVLKENAGNIILHPNGILDDHQPKGSLNNNNTLIVKLSTQQEERRLQKEIKQKEEAIKSRLYNIENFKPKRVKGSSFKFFKSKNEREEGDSSFDYEDDDDLVPEIRDFSSSMTPQFVKVDVHDKPASKILIDPVAFEDEDVELEGTTIAIESLLKNLDQSECEPLIPQTVSSTSLDALIDTLEGKSEKPANKPKMKLMGFGKNQLQIDAGQKNFGLVECKDCGFSYNTNVPEDEKLHNKHHQAVTTIPRFRGWSNEETMIINEWSKFDGHIIHLQPNNKKINSQHVTEIVSKMELEFGVQDDYQNRHIYLAAYDMKIVGIATIIESVLAKDEEEKVARVGIQRLFVRPEFRRKGVAKALLKTIVIMHHKGELLDLRNDVAFSSLTDDGKKLLENVVGTSKVFVFTP